MLGVGRKEGIQPEQTSFWVPQPSRTHELSSKAMKREVLVLEPAAEQHCKASKCFQTSKTALHGAILDNQNVKQFLNTAIAKFLSQNGKDKGKNRNRKTSKKCSLSLQGFPHLGQSGETSHAILLAPLSVTQVLNKMSILTKVNLQKELKMTYR